MGGWSGCSYGDECSLSGTRSRSVTTYTCSGGSCSGSTSTENDSGACGRDTSGIACGAGPVVGSWSPCTGDICGYSGTHTRTRQDRTCSGGTCATGGEYTEMEACTRDTDGIICESYPCDYFVCSGGTCSAYGGSYCTGGTTCCGFYCDYYCF